jgi:hypothetical protein
MLYNWTPSPSPASVPAAAQLHSPRPSPSLEPRAQDPKYKPCKASPCKPKAEASNRHNTEEDLAGRRATQKLRKQKELKNFQAVFGLWFTSFTRRKAVLRAPKA